MAIIFPSPKRKQRIFRGITILLLALILFVIPLIIFSPWFNGSKNIILEGIYKPDIKINFDVMDSDFVESLEPFQVSDSGENNLGRKEPFIPYYQIK